MIDDIFGSVYEEMMSRKIDVECFVWYVSNIKWTSIKNVHCYIGMVYMLFFDKHSQLVLEVCLYILHICSIQIQSEIQICAQHYSKWVCDPYLEYTAALSLLFVLKPTFIKHLCWTPCSSGFIKHLLNINPEQYWRRVPLTNSYSRPTSLSDKIEFQKIQIQIQVQHKIQRDIVENASNAIILSWSSCWLISGLPGWLSAPEISSIRSN